MLKDNFYSIVETDQRDTGFSFLLKLNETHVIYDGHFPGQPVVPGACFLQMVIELLEVVFEKKLKFLKADELKFLVPVNPCEGNMLQAQLSYVINNEEIINVTAVFSRDIKSPCFKCKASFIGM